MPELNSGDQIDVDSTLQGLVGAVDEPEAKEPKAPPPALLERFSIDQRKAFLEMWELIPPHLRDIHFDLDGNQWSPEDIRQFGDVFFGTKVDFQNPKQT